jgi:hypothetical protein
VDLGAAIPEANIMYMMQFLGDERYLDWSITLSYKTLVGDPWTDVVTTENPVSAATLATNFRYVKVLISVTNSSSSVYGSFINTRLLVGTKKQTTGGYAAVSSADAASGGTSISFGRDFISVIKVTASPIATSIGVGVQEIVNFTSIPYPTTFKVLLYDKDGNAVSGNISWDAEGLVSVSS